MTKCDKCKDPDYLETLFEHCQLDPETQEWERRIAYFYKANPKIYGIAYTAADVLRREKNLKVRNAAISIIHDEIKKRANFDSQNYSISRRKVTADQVREIVNAQHILLEGSDLEREKLAKHKAQELEEELYECPSCHNFILISLSKRDKIVSLRVTEDEDNLYTYISTELGVSRSKLLSVMLQAKYKYPKSFS